MNAWLAKVLICPQNNAVDIFEIGQHTARCAYPPTVKLNEKDKDVASYLAQRSCLSAAATCHPGKLALIASDVYETHNVTSESQFYARKTMAAAELGVSFITSG
ncbi:hypothetical protein F444_00278 [Phytophthora nicotianae P1976]|uniref:Uncharacterized protein n=1 Tax=Phytophthora nicotianae P1976 TaxID=1317066 RepID=A0A081B4U6_PHYNI|nr:hypothetical protein F444_00278 [Phytophthora nicotianae P1976]